MRITAVEALLVRQPEIDASVADGSQDGLVVRVRTDEGITGVGEVDSSPTVAKAVIEAPASHSISAGLAGLLIGEDPLEVGRLWDRLFEGSLYYGRRGVAIHALSGIDIALWDICGKVAGRPVCSLLGGRRRERVRAYASTLMPESPDEVRRVVSELCEQGFTGIKLGWGPLGRSAKGDLELVSAARAEAGEEVELMIDIGKGWRGASDALDRARALEELRPAWLEEPFMPDEYERYAQLSEAVSTPIAAGEEESTAWDFERLIERGRVGVAQPDVTRVGGISECMRAGELVLSRGRRFVPHAWSTGIIKAATLQVLGASREAEWLEYCTQDTLLNQRLVATRFPVLDGFVRIPDGPGLGIELDESVLEESTVVAGAVL